MSLSSKEPPGGDSNQANSDRERPVRVEETDLGRVELDLTAQVLFLDLAPEDRDEDGPAPLVPTLTALQELDPYAPRFVSGSMLAHKAKVFDDGLYAAVDLAAQNGAGRFAGKAGLLKGLLNELADPAADLSLVAGAVLFGAAKLGRLDVSVPMALFEIVEEALERFLADDLKSKPVGFYSWKDELRRVFQQDRLLQEPLGGAAEVMGVARALHARLELRQAYEVYLELVAGLTNPLVKEKKDLREILRLLDQGRMDVVEAKYHFFPPARSQEGDLAQKVLGTKDIPDGFSLVEEMITRIRDGRLDLTPKEDSGWYDYQTWALEPLVVPDRTPEAARLRFSKGYLKQLEELFKGILALTRETHIKQLEILMLGAAMSEFDEKPVVTIRPELTVEPLCTYYLRRAIGYGFIRRVLEDRFGPEGLKMLRGLRPGGEAGLNLAEELDRMSALFYGAFIAAGRDLGISRSEALGQAQDQVCGWLGLSAGETFNLGSGRGENEDAAVFGAWARQGGDGDLGRDLRMMVPVFYDVRRRKTKVWAFLGWSRRPLTVSFHQCPQAWIYDRQGRDITRECSIEEEPVKYNLAYPVTAELYVDKLMSRREFREHCDRHQTAREILSEL
ncbi:MAG: hypothetical protein AB1896_12770 [Thermodesulfobacteriota bacterium]